MTTTNGDASSSKSSQAEQIARRAKKAFNVASRNVASGAKGDETRKAVLFRLKSLLEEAHSEIQKANALDVEKAKQAGLSPSLISRLDLFSKPGKWQGMLDGISQVANLPNPLEQCTYAKRLAKPQSSEGEALDLYRITCPIGVLLCIFEARPEVIVNIACLSIKSGNAAILKGGKESQQSAAVLSEILRRALEESQELPSDLIQTVQTREDVNSLLRLDEYIDLIIPRGSNELVRNIQRSASIPVMGHADGLCSAYVHSDAEARSTIANLIDAKIDYPAACNAVETILVHKSHLSSQGLLAPIVKALIEANVTTHLEEDCYKVLDDNIRSSSNVKQAQSTDFDTEFLSLDVAIKSVDSLDDAIAHINEHGSHHTDVIFTASSSSNNPSHNEAAATFVRSIDSANVYVNASTRFADGFRYGFGTEVGISTGKMHARGPVGLEGLVTYKYVLQGYGGRQICADFSAPESANGRSFAHEEINKQYPSL
ncbi:hypothetical protein L7F22_042020 [Adiantum nelumboides]|nr:hypothetical protein [Adiantum nelumboides]